MLKNNNLSYTSQNHSSVTILKHFVYRWQMNITEILSIIISTFKRLKQFVRSFKGDDINKSCILLSDEQTYLITTS